MSRAFLFLDLYSPNIVLSCHLIQIRLENPSYPSTRLAIQLPSLGFHFSPARYHRLMRIAKLFQDEDNEDSDSFRPWNQADFEGWLSTLTRKVSFFLSVHPLHPFLCPMLGFCEST